MIDVFLILTSVTLHYIKPVQGSLFQVLLGNLSSAIGHLNICNLIREPYKIPSKLACYGFPEFQVPPAVARSNDFAPACGLHIPRPWSRVISGLSGAKYFPHPMGLLDCAA